jgi:hypothetical protein
MFFYGYKIWCFITYEERRLRVFENSVLGRNPARGWATLHDVVLRNLCSSPNNIRGHQIQNSGQGHVWGETIFVSSKLENNEGKKHQEKIKSIPLGLPEVKVPKISR